MHTMILWNRFNEGLKPSAITKRILLEELNRMQYEGQRYRSIGYTIRLTRIKITAIAIFTPHAMWSVFYQHI